jgi:hypothetical protein
MMDSIEPNESLARTGHSSDEADGFVVGISSVTHDFSQRVCRFVKVFSGCRCVANFEDLVIGIESDGSINDRRDWTEDALVPCCSVNAWQSELALVASDFDQRFAYRLRRGHSACPYNILSKRAYASTRDVTIRNYQRYDRTLGARLVEANQVNCVIIDLPLCRGGGEARLRFDSDNHVVHEQHCINAFANAWDRILEKDFEARCFGHRCDQLIASRNQSWKLKPPSFNCLGHQGKPRSAILN